MVSLNRFTELPPETRAQTYAFLEALMGDHLLEIVRVLYRDTLPSRLEFRRPTQEAASELWEKEWRTIPQIRELRHGTPYGFNETSIRRIMEERLLSTALVDKREEDHPKRRKLQNVFLYRPTDLLDEMLHGLSQKIPVANLSRVLTARATEIASQLQEIEAAASAWQRLQKSRSAAQHG